MGLIRFGQPGHMADQIKTYFKPWFQNKNGNWIQGWVTLKGELHGKTAIISDTGSWFNLSHHKNGKWHGEFFSTEFTGESLLGTCVEGKTFG